MSFEDLENVLNLPLRGPAKAVLCWLAVSRNSRTGQLNPGVARLAAACGLSKRAVRKAIRTLERGGFITVQRVDGMPSNYMLTPERGSPLNTVHPCTSSPLPLNTVHPKGKKGSIGADAAESMVDTIAQSTLPDSPGGWATIADLGYVETEADRMAEELCRNLRNQQKAASQ